MVIYYSYKGTFIGLGKNWLPNLELVEVQTGQIFDRFLRKTVQLVNVMRAKINYVFIDLVSVKFLF